MRFARQLIAALGGRRPKLKQYGFGRIADLEPAMSGSADQLNQLAMLKKQAAAVLDKMKQFEQRIAGRS